MTRVLIAAPNGTRAADATAQTLELFGGDQSLIALIVLRSALVTAPVTDGGDSVAGRLDLGETETGAIVAPPGQPEADARSEFEDELRRRHLDVKPRVRVEIGEPGEIYCRVAAEERAELIVLVRRSRRLVSRIRLGGVTQHVIEHAHCPVLVVHERDN